MLFALSIPASDEKRAESTRFSSEKLAQKHRGIVPIAAIEVAKSAF
jgi:hypothetical protein